MISSQFAKTKGTPFITGRLNILNINESEKIPVNLPTTRKQLQFPTMPLFSGTLYCESLFFCYTDCFCQTTIREFILWENWNHTCTTTPFRFETLLDLLMYVIKECNLSVKYGHRHPLVVDWIIYCSYISCVWMKEAHVHLFPCKYKWNALQNRTCLFASLYWEVTNLYFFLQIHIHFVE